MDAGAPAPEPPSAAYTQRLEEQRAELARLARRFGLLSGLRRVGMGLIVVLCVLTEYESLPVKLVLVGVPAFILDRAIKRRQKVTLAWQRCSWVAWYCEQRLLRLGEGWAGTGDPGTQYLDPEHPCATDLDLFGPGSLFERLSASWTPAGERALARWLLAPADAEVVRQRQAAVAELRDRPALREELARLAGECPAGIDHRELVEWGRRPSVPFPAALTWAAWLVPLLTLLAFVGLAAGRLSPAWFAAALAVQVLLALALRRRATAVLGQVEELPHG